MNKNVSNELLTAEALRVLMQKANEDEVRHEHDRKARYNAELAKAVKRVRRTIRKVFEIEWAPRLKLAAHNIRRNGNEKKTFLINIATAHSRDGLLNVREEAKVVCGIDFLKKIGYKARRVGRQHSGDFVDVYIEVDWSKN